MLDRPPRASICNDSAESRGLSSGVPRSYLAGGPSCTTIGKSPRRRIHFPAEGRDRKVMGERKEPRTQVSLPVRIFGTDIHGRPFSENVNTVDISREGARLNGVTAEIKAGEIVGVTHGPNKARFLVKWAGQPGSPQQGQVGLQNMSPQKPLWEVVLPGSGADSFGRQSKAAERRLHPRVKSMNSVELHPDGQSAPIWGKAADLSLGGCFVEMPMPLKKGTSLKVGLWINERKLWVSGKVVNSRPGFGIGIQFTEVAPEDLERMRQFLQSLTRLPL